MRTDACADDSAPLSSRAGAPHILEGCIGECVYAPVRSEAATEFPKAPADCAYAYAMLVFVALRVTSPRVLTCSACPADDLSKDGSTDPRCP